MFLNQELLQASEEFFEQILNDENCEELDEAISSLRYFLEKDVDGFTQYMDENLGYAVQSRLTEIWKMISTKEKDENYELVASYQDLLSLTEDACEYEADDLEEEE
jgi:hypothetical protein